MNFPGEMVRRCRGVLLPVLFALGFSALFAARQDTVVPESRAEQDTSLPQASDGVPEGVSASLMKKLDLLNTMLDGRLGQRIETSRNDRAKQTMREARAMVEDSRRAIDRGDENLAEQWIAKAFIVLSRASREVEDQGRANQLQKREYERALARTRSFRQTYDQLLSDPDMAGENKSPLDRAHYQSSLEAAGQQARAGNYVEANRLINSTLQALESALVALQSSQTLVGSLDFDDPEVSYQYEKERNESNRRLLAVVARSVEDDPDEAQRLALISKMKVRADEQRAEAELSARQGDFETASRVMESANRTLVQAQHLSGFRLSQ